jgi:amino acid transporter
MIRSRSVTHPRLTERGHAYPNGGGAYAVSRENLGRDPSLVAASALLVDYVLTVAVSVAAGVANIVSAVPELASHAVGVSVGMIAVLAVMNLRGVKESGTVFAIPTYGFISIVLVMIGVGAVRTLIGDAPVAESAPFDISPEVQAGGLIFALLAMRAFASGCTAMTGVEAVSNGVPNFKPPKSKNAASTLAIMGAITVAMFAGITSLAMISRVHVAADPAMLTGAPAGYEQRTVIAQVAGAVFGGYDSIGFFAVQGFTAAILILAANTTFNGFPILASLLGRDGFLPRQFARRGDRLVFSNGIIILAALAALLTWAFDASTTRLIQLYIIGVFVSFTLSQAGMVVHDEIARHARAQRLAAHDHGDLSAVPGQVHRRLSRGVPGTDDVHVAGSHGAGLAAGRAVEHPGADQPLQAGHLESPPRDSGRDHCPRDDACAVGGAYLVLRTVAGHERGWLGEHEVGPEQPRLLTGAVGEVAPADVVSEAGIVADLRAGAAWPPGRFASSKRVSSPSDAAYTAAVSPAGPAPTMATSQRRVSVVVLAPWAARMSDSPGCINTLPSKRTRIGRRVASTPSRSSSARPSTESSGWNR